MPFKENIANMTYLLSSVRKRKLSGANGARHLRISVYILCFSVEGEGAIVIDDVLHNVRPFQLFLLVPGMKIEVPEQDGQLEYYGILFEPIRLTKIRGRYEGTPYLMRSDSLSKGHLPLYQPQQLLQQILRLYAHSKQQGSKGSAALRMEWEELIHLIVRSDSGRPSVLDERVERSITFMEQHYTGRVSMEQLAEAAGGMSPVAFSRLFRDETSMLPVEYLSHVRINQAKQLLNKKSCRVKEVAAAVGFRSEFYFSRMFQRLAGVSPTLYMKRGSLKVAVASSLGFEDHLRSVGIEPVCVVDLYQYPGHSKEHYEESVGNQMLELRRSSADLIIADHYHAEFRELFKSIATPVYLDFSVWDWRSNYKKIAELVNREQEAAVMLTRLELKALTTGQAIRRILGKERVTVMQVNHQSIGIQGRFNHPLNELIYGELALEPGNQTPSETWRIEMQPNAMPVLETEHLFIHQHHVQAGSGELYREMVRQKMWQQIPAVRNGKSRFIPNWFAMSWSPLGRQLIMDELLVAVGVDNWK